MADRPVTRRRTSGRVLALGLALALVGAACSSSKSDAGHAATTTGRHRGSTTTTGSPATSATSPPTSSAISSTTTTIVGPPNCSTSQLTAGLGAGQGAAGHVIVPLVLTNHGGATCVLSGYPGVSLLDGSGATIGTPATRATRPVAPVAVAPGAGIQTELESQNPGLSPTPCWPTSVSIKVYPPNQLDSLTIAGAFQVCGGEFTVTPMASA